MESVVLIPPSAPPITGIGEGAARNRLDGVAPIAKGSRRRHPLATSRIVVWAGAVAVGAGLAAAGQPLGLAGVMLALSGCVAAAAAPGPSNRGFGLLGSLPAGFVVVCSWALTWGLLGGIVGIATLATRAGAILGAAVLVVLTGTIAWRRNGLVEVIGCDGPAAGGFVTLVAFFGSVVASQPFPVWSRINGLGTDFLRHLAFIRLTGERGLLVPGEPSYPKALSSLGAWLSAMLGIPSTADTLWRAIAPLTFLILALMLISVMSISTHLTDRLLGGTLPRVVAALIAGIVFVQTAWFSTFLEFGNVMNMLVGVSLVAMLAQGLQVKSFGSTSGTLLAGAALAVTANAWQLLLPVVALGALPWFVQFLRRGRSHLGGWLVWVTSAALTANGVLGLRQIDGRGQTGVSTVSNLFRPDWWWWLALAASVLAVVVAFRRGLRSWAVVAMALMTGGVVLVAFLLLWTGSSWELMRYYPVKALWTATVVLVPLCVTGAVLTVVSVWRAVSGRGSALRLATRGATALMIGVALVGVVGRGAAFPPHLLTIANGGVGLPNWSLAVIDSMQGVPIAEESEEGAIVLGVIPSTNVQGVVSGFVGMADYMAMESLSHLGIEGAEASPVKFDLIGRDMEQLCLYLKKYPASLRITGPNPAAGPDWLIDSGCPESVVKPANWLSLQFDPAWLERSSWEDRVWRYPTAADVAQAQGPLS